MITEVGSKHSNYRSLNERCDKPRFDRVTCHGDQLLQFVIQITMTHQRVDADQRQRKQKSRVKGTTRHLLMVEHQCQRPYSVN
jgi:hypothetical protein